MSLRHMSITTTGCYGKDRRLCKEWIETLGATYSGSLVMNSTTHLLCQHQPGLLTGIPSQKMVVALSAGVPIVSIQWLFRSYIAGKFLDISEFIVVPAQGASLVAASSSPPERLRAALPTHAPGFHDPISQTDQHVVLFQGRHTPDSCRSATKKDAGFRKAAGEGVLEAEPISDSQIRTPQEQPFDLHNTEALSAFESLGLEENRIDISIPSGAAKLRAPSPAALSWSRASTIVLGNARAGDPGPSTLLALRREHGAKLAATATFYASATVTTESGRELKFVLGDIAHGAKMLFDIDPTTGRKEHAMVLIKSIYNLDASPWEIWMEHHYLFSLEDIQQRPAWDAALEEMQVNDGELLLSCGCYISPLHLVTGDFGVSISPDSLGSNSKWVALDGINPQVSGFFPIYQVRAAFDGAAGVVAPLKDALCSFKG